MQGMNLKKALMILACSCVCALNAMAEESTIKDVMVQNDLNATALKYKPESVDTVAQATSTATPVATPAVAPAVQPAAETPAAPVYLLSDIFKKFAINVSGSVTVDYYTSYIWRGQVLDHDAVIQPGASLTFNDLTVGYWGNMDLTNNDSLSSGESDYYVSLSHTFANLITLGGGHTWYGFPGVHTNSKEFFATATVITLLNPTFTFAHDYDDGKNVPKSLGFDGQGNYYSLGLSYSLPLKDKYGSSIEFGNTLGYVDGQWVAGRGWHVTPSVGLKLMLAANISIIPTIGYNFPMNDLKDPAIGNQKNKVFSAVRTAYSF